MIRIRVHYPPGPRVALRTSLDWDRDRPPIAVSDDGTVRTFEVRPPVSRPLLHVKPVRIDGDSVRWSAGANYVASPGTRDIYPHFSEGGGEVGPPVTLGGHTVRVYTPAGYRENLLKRYPTLYLLDGANVFFPEEAFNGTPWHVGETLDTLDAMNLVDRLVVVAVHSADGRREADYSLPGLPTFADALVRRVKPEVDARYRTLRDPDRAAIIGSSLGGVAAMYIAWRWPEVIGMAGCLSSTFGWRDDLLQRVWSDPKPPVRLYLDSGWPGDNYDETRVMRDALLVRGFRPGVDLMHLAFPGALHHERAWAQRVHLPLQFFFGDAFRPRSQLWNATS